MEEGSDLGASCPRCGEPTELVDEPYDTAPAPAPTRLVGPRVEVLLDNVRSLSNVGTIFRSADGAGVSHIHLAGVTPTPEHPKLAKTALGAERAVAWSRHADPLAAARALADAGAELWALEGGDGDSLFELLPVAGDRTICLVLGHEVSGIDPRILALCSARAHLPMAGVKGSLNVAVAFSVAAYALRHGLVPAP